MNGEQLTKGHGLKINSGKGLKKRDVGVKAFGFRQVVSRSTKEIDLRNKEEVSHPKIGLRSSEGI